MTEAVGTQGHQQKNSASTSKQTSVSLNHNAKQRPGCNKGEGDESLIGISSKDNQKRTVAAAMMNHGTNGHHNAISSGTRDNQNTQRAVNDANHSNQIVEQEDDDDHEDDLSSWGFQLDELYRIALKFYRENENKAFHVSYDERNTLAALNKQIIYGKFNQERAPPLGTLDFVGRDRRQRWIDLQNLSRSAAKKRFIRLLNSLCPRFKPFVDALKVDAEEKRRKQEEQERLRLVQEEQQRLEDEAKRKAEEENRRCDEQRRQIQEALNRQTYNQFKAYAEAQYPGQPEDQQVLIRQLQEQHFQQYMQQIYQQQFQSNRSQHSSGLFQSTMFPSSTPSGAYPYGPSGQSASGFGLPPSAGQPNSSLSNHMSALKLSEQNLPGGPRASSHMYNTGYGGHPASNLPNNVPSSQNSNPSTSVNPPQLAIPVDQSPSKVVSLSEQPPSVLAHGVNDSFCSNGASSPQSPSRTSSNEPARRDADDSDGEEGSSSYPLTSLACASMWTRKDIKEFKESITSEGTDGIIKVGHGEIVTVRVPTHEDGSCIFWEFATDSYDIGFGLLFEWTKNPGTTVSVHVSESEDEDDDEIDEEDVIIGGSGGNSVPNDVESGSGSSSSRLPLMNDTGDGLDQSSKDPESQDGHVPHQQPLIEETLMSPEGNPISVIIPIFRRDSHEEVYAGSHEYPGQGVYLLKFDNSYSLWRSKTLYYRVYYTK